MNELKNYLTELNSNGFTTIQAVYTQEELDQIITIIGQADSSNSTFRKSADLFAIRQFLKEIPDILPVLLNENLKKIIREIFGPDYFVVKSIYFDKPEQSNWFVAYHQDLTISVDKKTELKNFGPWSVKQNQFAVQPPIEILEGLFTIRIHIDEANENNGALRVIPQSHLKKIYRPETIDWAKEQEVICKVEAGGVMLMKPLLLHSSGRTTNNKKRRVIHIEFSNTDLPQNLNWAEKLVLF